MEMEMERKMDMDMMAPNIPNHIIVEILFRLSPKSLLRLRWTCKYWFDLITRDPVFIIRMHLHHRATTTTTTTTHDHEILRIISSSLYGIHCRNVDHSKNCKCGTEGGVLHVSSELRTTIASLFPEILGSCNGLILINESGRESLSIWNPFTREYRFLPFPHRYGHPLALNNFGSNNFGFGYDHTSDDYKVIRNTYYHYASHNNDDFNNSDVQVYTLGTNSWRRIAPNPYRLQHTEGVFVNGALYWMDYRNGNIVSFDIGKERFEHVAKTSNLTRRDEDSSCNVKLQVFEGSLCVVLKIKEEQQNYYRMEMWVLTKDYTVNNNDDEIFWTKLSTIPNLHDLMFPIKPLRYTINGDILMVTNHNDLVLYDPKNNKDRNLGKICAHSSELVKDVYSESLVSVNSGTYAK